MMQVFTHGPSSAYQATVGEMYPGALPAAASNRWPLPTEVNATRGGPPVGGGSVAAIQAPSAELVGANQDSGRNTTAPPDGVHCMTAPGDFAVRLVAHRKRSLAIHLPPTTVASVGADAKT